MDVSYKIYKCLCATTLHFVNIVLSEMIISDRYLEFSVWGGLTFEGKLWWREEAVKRQRQHKVFCHVITRAFQLHLLSQGSQSFIYNPLHCMPASAPFEVPERARVCVWESEWAESTAWSRGQSQQLREGGGVSCLLSLLYTHTSERHQHFWISAQSTTPWSSGSFFLLNQQYFAERDYMALSGRIQQTSWSL